MEADSPVAASAEAEAELFETAKKLNVFMNLAPQVRKNVPSSSDHGLTTIENFISARGVLQQDNGCRPLNQIEGARVYTYAI